MLFSIIIPTYNRANQVRIAINSVLNQKYKRFELIIVDDGSTDHTKEIVAEFNDSRIAYYKKENEERNIARNFGIKKAKGDYISFLDSDDELYPNHLKSAHTFISNKQYPNVIHLNFELKKNDKISPSYITTNRVNDINKELIKENILSCNSIFISRDTLCELKFLDSENAIVGEDHFLWLKLAARYKIHHSKEVTNVVIEHGERSLNNINPDKLMIGAEEIVYTLKQDNTFLKYYGWRAQKMFANYYIFVALILVTNKRKKESAYYLKLAILHFPFCFFSKKYLAVIKHLLIQFVSIK